MTYFFRSSAALLALVLAIETGTTQAQTQAPSRPVGLTFRHYTDAHRQDWSGQGPRPLNTAIWYPAPAGTAVKEWSIAIFKAGVNAIDAPLADAPNKLPLLLLSHGTGGSAASLAWLAQALAEQGYIVAGVNHHGNTGAEPEQTIAGVIEWWQRPHDVSVLLDQLLADPSLGSRIDPKRIGVVGFSIGGYTALATVGARIDYARYQSLCEASPDDAMCKMPPEAARFSADDVRRFVTTDPAYLKEALLAGDSYRDPRIKAAWVIAPPLGPMYRMDSLAALQVPVEIVAGEQDHQVPPDSNAKPIAAAVPGAQLRMLPLATHYTFLDSCTALGRAVAAPLCSDPSGVDRDQVHRQAAQLALQFFDRNLTVGTATPSDK